MLKIKLLEKFKAIKLYTLYRKIRFVLNIRPLYKKIRESILFYLKGLYDRSERHHLFLFSAGLAFSIFVCIIPFVLIIFAVLGSVLDSSSMQVQVNTLIETIIPYPHYADVVKNIIFKRINEVIEYKTIAGIIGGFGLFFAASGLFSSMRTILNKVFEVDIEEHFILSKIKDFALIIMVILIFFITTFLLPVIEVIRESADKLGISNLFTLGIFAHLIYSAFSFLLIFIVFLILYFSVPTIRLNKKSTFFSALWAAILWEAAKQGFGYYIHNYATLGAIYGTYSIFVVVAFWIYYSSAVFIIGAEFGKLYSERRYFLHKGEKF